MEKSLTLVDPNDIKILSSPYRLQIMSTFQSYGEPATVKEIADLMGETPAKVHYHVKILEGIGILQLVHTKEINGIIAKYYEPTARDINISPENISDSLRDSILNQTQLMIANTYDDSKNFFLEQVRKEPKPSGIFSYTDLYLTEEEAKELQDYIRNLCNQHTHKSNHKKTGAKRYRFFYSMIGHSSDQ